ncbi:hypothetical protein [Methanoplanus limicola]|uniref:Uncharacterized protein n=1 Tax=Methanoplanus limicola DSM 2279 TaxID=937775 RepID=H1YZZ1_9EURY|nr:hypothetical protein [Methanoplanus limicola]EHQ35198.1 hypothetical protein Metlim_1084 [Methanoplanus limicola DSM 2279]
MKPEKIIRALNPLLIIALLAAMFIPAVSAEEAIEPIDSNQDITNLFEPINNEIVNKMATIVTKDGFAKTTFNPRDYSEKLMCIYQKNLDQIIDLLEKKTGQKLSTDEKEDLKKIIIQEHMDKVSWAQLKEKMGVKDENFKPMLLSQGKILTHTEQSRLPLSLILVQVSDDIYGGAGLDGAGIPYIVNGENDLLSVSVNTAYTGKDLYECLFMDEDAPNTALDISYDELRMQVYGTLHDIQGFFITEPDDHGHRYIEFGNDYDNGNSYGTVIGQHGALTTSWNVGYRIYISNVWNHAMSLDNRNSNMATKTYYYY